MTGELRKAWRFFLFLTSFGLARGGLFVAPLVLANLLTPADYGTLEFAQAVASMGATLLAMGTVGVVPLVLVRNLGSVSWGAILLHQASAVALLILIALGCFAVGAPAAIWLSAVGIAVLMLQALWSVTLKSQGNGEASLLLDAGFWGVLALAAILAYFLELPTVARWDWVIAALLAYLVALASWTVWRLVASRPRTPSWLYVPTVRTGLPLMAGTLLSYLATTSGRLGIGFLSTPEMTADYAVLFRATALPMVAHQVIMVARFRQVFAMPASELERYLPLVVGLVTATVVLFWGVGDVAGVVMGPAFVSAFLRNHTEGLLILTQCIMWSAIAQNEMLNNRWQTAGKLVLPSTLYFMLVLPLAWWFLSSRPITLSLFVPVHSAVMAGYFLTQVIVMWSCGIRMVRTWALTFGCFVGLSVLTQLI